MSEPFRLVDDRGLTGCLVVARPITDAAATGPGVAPVPMEAGAAALPASARAGGSSWAAGGSMPNRSFKALLYCSMPTLLVLSLIHI